MKIKETLRCLWNHEYSLKKTFWFFGVGGYIIFLLTIVLIYSVLTVFLDLDVGDSLFLYGTLALIFSSYMTFFSISLYKTAKHCSEKRLWKNLAYAAALILFLFGIRGIYNSLTALSGSLAIASHYGHYGRRSGRLREKILGWSLLLGAIYLIQLIWFFLKNWYSNSKNRKPDWELTEDDTEEDNEDEDEDEEYSQLPTSGGIPRRSPALKTEIINITHASKHEIIKQCHEATQKVHEEFTTLAEYTNLDWFFEGIKNKINRQQDEAYKVIQEAEITPKEFIYNHIASLALDFILSGQYCIYRGTLNMEGHALKKLFLHINNEQQRLGYITREIADDNVKYLNEELAKIG